MPGRKKITELPTISDGELTDTLPIAAVNLGDAETVKVLLGQVKDYVGDDILALSMQKSANLSDVDDAEAATGNLLFKFLSSDAVVRTVTAVLREKAVSVVDFGGVGDGVTNDGPAFQKAVDFCIATNRPLYVPSGYFWNIATTVTVNPTPPFDKIPRPARYPGAFAAGLIMFGDGMAASFILPSVVDGPAFDINVQDPTPYAYRAAQGMHIHDLAFLGSNAVSGCIGIRLFNSYQSKIERCHFKSLSGTGVKMINGVEGTVPDSGWNMVELNSCWFEGNANDGDGWGVDATGGEGRNEGSFTQLQHCFFQGNGLNQYFTITGIADSGGVATVTVNLNQMPAAAPTAAAHPFVEGDELKGFGVKRTTTLALNPITTVNTSPIVTIAMTAHGMAVGDVVNLTGATATGGLTITGDYVVSSVATNTFTIIHSSAATSSASGGGAAVVCISPMTAFNDQVFSVGPDPTATTFKLYQSGAPVSAATWGTWKSDLLDPVTINNNPIATTLSSATVTITHTAHGAVAGDLVTLAGATDVGGLTISGQYRVVSVPNVNTYTITAASAATSTASGGGASVTAQYTYRTTIHGEVGYYEPRSGGMRSKGQLVKLQQCGFTVNQNIAHYVPGGAGGNIGLLCEQVTWENNYRRHIFVRGGINYYFVGCQFHGNNVAGLRQWRLAEFDASDNVIYQVLWQNTTVRAKECPATAFKYSGAQGSPNNVRVRGVIWSDFDYARQKRFVGVQFDPIQQDLGLSWTSTALMALRPNQVAGRGNKSPIRLRGPINDSGTGVSSVTGEWAEFQPTSNGGVFCYNTVTGLSVGAGLANSTVYNIYLYDNDGVAAMIPSLVEPTIDPEHGYMVMTGDPTMLWVGRAVTDGSAQWANTDTQFLNPLLLPATGQGTFASMWHSDIDRKLRIKSSVGLPASLAGGTYDYWPSFEAVKTHDFGSIAAGASETTTLTSAVTCALGDYVTGVSLSIDTQGIILAGYVSAANTITVVARNPTAGAIDLASATLRVSYQRR